MSFSLPSNRMGHVADPCLNSRRLIIAKHGGIQDLAPLLFLPTFTIYLSCHSWIISILSGCLSHSFFLDCFWNHFFLFKSMLNDILFRFILSRSWFNVLSPWLFLLLLFFFRNYNLSVDFWEEKSWKGHELFSFINVFGSINTKESLKGFSKHFINFFII